MPITELAIIPLKPGTTSTSTALLSHLRTAKSTQESLSKYPAYYFAQIEDPSLIYILGSWDSPAAHLSILPSKENQEIIALIADEIDFKDVTMYHLDLDMGVEKIPVDAPVVSINRHFVKGGRKDEFRGCFDGVKGLLEEYTKPKPIAGGWRIEKEEGKEEFVLFSGFEGVESHYGFAKTEEFERYKAITGFVDGFEVRHLRRLDV